MNMIYITYFIYLIFSLFAIEAAETLQLIDNYNIYTFNNVFKKDFFNIIVKDWVDNYKEITGDSSSKPNEEKVLDLIKLRYPKTKITVNDIRNLIESPNSVKERSQNARIIRSVLEALTGLYELATTEIDQTTEEANDCDSDPYIEDIATLFKLGKLCQEQFLLDNDLKALDGREETQEYQKLTLLKTNIDNDLKQLEKDNNIVGRTVVLTDEQKGTLSYLEKALNKINSYGMMNNYATFIGSRHFETSEDHKNLVETNTKYHANMEKYRYNPVPLTVKNIKLFPNIETVYCYSESDIQTFVDILKSEDNQIKEIVNNITGINIFLTFKTDLVLPSKLCSFLATYKGDKTNDHMVKLKLFVYSNIQNVGTVQVKAITRKYFDNMTKNANFANSTLMQRLDKTDVIQNKDYTWDELARYTDENGTLVFPLGLDFAVNNYGSKTASKKIKSIIIRYDKLGSTNLAIPYHVINYDGPQISIGEHPNIKNIYFTRLTTCTFPVFYNFVSSREQYKKLRYYHNCDEGTDSADIRIVNTAATFLRLPPETLTIQNKQDAPAIIGNDKVKTFIMPNHFDDEYIRYIITLYNNTNIEFKYYNTNNIIYSENENIMTNKTIYSNPFKNAKIIAIPESVKNIPTKYIGWNPKCSVIRLPKHFINTEVHDLFKLNSPDAKIIFYTNDPDDDCESYLEEDC